MPRKRLTEDNYQFAPDDKSAPVVLAAHRSPPMEFKCGRNTVRFSHLYGQGLDDIVKHLHVVLWERRRTPERFSASSVHNGWNAMERTFLPFLAEMRVARGHDLTLADLDEPLIRAYIDWLRYYPARTSSGFLAYTGQRVYYKNVKGLLNTLSQRWVLRSAAEIFPKNPYPNSNRRGKPHKAYSTAERNRLLQALWSDLCDWHAGVLKLTVGTVLTIILLLMAARCGRNTSALLGLTIHSLRDHPLKADRKLLVTYKRRGFTTHIQSFARDSEEIERIIPVRTDVTRLFELALEITAPFRKDAPEEMRDALWCYRSEAQDTRGLLTVLNDRSLYQNAARFVIRNKLLADDGNPLQVTISRLRKTFDRRIWEITDGNLLATAMLGGHTLTVADAHYLEAPPEAERNFKWCGEAWVDKLRGVEESNTGDAGTKIVRTPVAHCGDSLYGKYAPKNGYEHCSNFLSCFRCPSQIVTGDDLWRLMSFYWLLIKERGVIPRKRWSRIYGFVIREIDRAILPNFDKELVGKARERARIDPHPMWRDRSMLYGEPTAAESI